MPHEHRSPAPPTDMEVAPPAVALPAWPVVLRALREAAGVNQEAWARALEVGRTTVQRWERGETVPDPTGQARVLALGRERGLFRRYGRGALAGVSLTADLVAELLADARREVRGGAAPPMRSVMAPATQPGDRGRSTLPSPLSSFVGRAVERATVQRLLGSTRLLTLTGTGGVGKTRLALEVARTVADQYPDGVWWVDLAALTDPALVPQAVASALEVREPAGQPLTETLAQFLTARHLLLVLDNCEHLVTACAALTERLLSAAAQVQVLATSREGLRVPGETRYRVPSLTLPDRALCVLPSADGLIQSEAVRLFVERARAVWLEFALTAATARAVTEICWQLDGIPLALELAAARVPVLAVEQLAARLDDRFRVLTGGSRTALPRYQTLRATLDWSYDLLSERERALLRRLAVFAGGWSLEAAEAVCAGAGIETGELLDLLTQLVDKSLVVVETVREETRYRLLETVRHYGWEKLREAGEAERVQRRHRDFFLSLAEQAGPRLEGPEQIAWLDRLAAEHDNLRAALAWSLEGAQEAEAALRLGRALRGFWEVRGYLSEGRQWLDRALAAGTDAPMALRAAALHSAGLLAYREGDPSAAGSLAEASLALFRGLDDRGGTASALGLLGLVALQQDNWRHAAERFEEALALQRTRGHEPGMAWALNNLGLVLLQYQGEYERARAVLEESLALHQEVGNKRGSAFALRNLGYVMLSMGDLERATSLFEASLALYRELDDRSGISATLSGLGEVARQQGEFARAAARYQEALPLYRALGNTRHVAVALHNLAYARLGGGEVPQAAALFAESLALSQAQGSQRGIAYRLMGIAAIAVAQGRAERAARLLGAAAALFETAGAVMDPVERTDYNRTLAAARAALGEEGFAAAWAAGQALPLEQAIAEALAEAAPEPWDSSEVPPRLV